MTRSFIDGTMKYSCTERGEYGRYIVHNDEFERNIGTRFWQDERLWPD